MVIPTLHTRILAAGMIQVGSFVLVHSRDSMLEPKELTSIRKVSSQGAYAPFTVTGTLMVGCIAVSNYIALPSVLELSVEQQHGLQPLIYVPYRGYCNWFGCPKESYDSVSGLPRAAAMRLPLVAWFEQDANWFVVKQSVSLSLR